MQVARARGSSGWRVKTRGYGGPWRTLRSPTRPWREQARDTPWRVGAPDRRHACARSVGGLRACGVSPAAITAVQAALSGHSACAAISFAPDSGRAVERSKRRRSDPHHRASTHYAGGRLCAGPRATDSGSSTRRRTITRADPIGQNPHHVVWQVLTPHGGKAARRDIWRSEDRYCGRSTRAWSTGALGMLRPSRESKSPAPSDMQHLPRQFERPAPRPTAPRPSGRLMGISWGRDTRSPLNLKDAYAHGSVGAGDRSAALATAATLAADRCCRRCPRTCVGPRRRRPCARSR